MLCKDFDKPLVADLLDRLAHRSSRYAKAPRNLGLVDRGPGRQVAHDDGFADKSVDLLAQRKLAAQ
jgi:hypothetical protein